MNHPASTSSLDDLDVGALRATQSDYYYTPIQTEQNKQLNN
jgi:hypothetical protein